MVSIFEHDWTWLSWVFWPFTSLQQFLLSLSFKPDNSCWLSTYMLDSSSSIFQSKASMVAECTSVPTPLQIWTQLWEISCSTCDYDYSPPGGPAGCPPLCTGHCRLVALSPVCWCSPACSVLAWLWWCVRGASLLLCKRGVQHSHHGSLLPTGTMSRRRKVKYATLAWSYWPCTPGSLSDRRQGPWHHQLWWRYRQEHPG